MWGAGRGKSVYLSVRFWMSFVSFIILIPNQPQAQTSMEHDASFFSTWVFFFFGRRPSSASEAGTGRTWIELCWNDQFHIFDIYLNVQFWLSIVSLIIKITTPHPARISMEHDALFLDLMFFFYDGGRPRAQRLRCKRSGPNVDWIVLK